MGCPRAPRRTLTFNLVCIFVLKRRHRRRAVRVQVQADAGGLAAALAAGLVVGAAGLLAAAHLGVEGQARQAEGGAGLVGALLVLGVSGRAVRVQAEGGRVALRTRVIGAADKSWLFHLFQAI